MEYRGHGIGRRLMQIAREQAQEQGYKRLSLVVFEENTAALRLYQSLGYEVVKRAPVVPHPLIRCGGDALLMVTMSS
jgi:ribosomal protein S18 acetylase RimI-like enzyme